MAPLARRKNPGRGSKKRNQLMIQVYADEDLVGELRDLAKKEGNSMSEQIRQVLTWGLETLEEANELR